MKSPNFNDRPAGTPIDMLVIHYTGMPSAEAALTRMCDPKAEVSAHYMIDEAGAVSTLVAEEKRAWHAGLSSWRGESNLNNRAIGIELVNPGHEFGYRPYTAVQMTSLVVLAKGILSRWPIPPRNVVGHSDVAPRRKQDPGELFDWHYLSQQGIGLWPKPGVAEGDPAALLAAYGYETEELSASLTAFQRHFRPRLCDGIADAETLSLLNGLVTAVTLFAQ